LGKVNPIAKLMIGIHGTLSEFELNRIKERQLEGIEKAKAKGV
jgi:DNA invertase Pin-like site-specific DNA recombinase